MRELGELPPGDVPLLVAAAERAALDDAAAEAPELEGAGVEDAEGAAGDDDVEAGGGGEAAGEGTDELGGGARGGA